jgi:hypothetical protein
MKKNLFLVGAVVFLATAFFGCSEQVLEEEAAPKYDSKNRPLVEFTIPTRAYEKSGIRALHKGNAQAAWDYVEVVISAGTVDSSNVFTPSNEYYVGAESKGNNIYFALPQGTYQAIMFMGIAKGNKLLAIGVPTDTKNKNGGTIDGTFDNQGLLKITEETVSIDFKLSALTLNITAEDNLIFKDASNDSLMTNQAITTQTIMIDGKNTPYFRLNKGKQITGMFNIKGLNDNTPVHPLGALGVPNADLLTTVTSGAPPSETTSVTLHETKLFGIVDDGIKVPFEQNIITSIGLPFYKSNTGSIFLPMKIDITVTSIKIVAGDLQIAFKFGTDNLEAFSKIRFDVPIQAFNFGTNTSSYGSVWHIVNGFEAGAMDLGSNSIGQNILLAIGNNLSGQYVIAPTIPDDPAPGDGGTP